MANYPTAVAAGAAVHPDSVSNVLDMSISQLDDVEQRLLRMLDKTGTNLNRSLGAPAVPAEDKPAHILGQALRVRNLSARIIDRCNELDSIL